MYPKSPVEYHTTNDKADKNDDLQNQSDDDNVITSEGGF
jgi:hypothetical protein